MHRDRKLLLLAMIVAALMGGCGDDDGTPPVSPTTLSRSWVDEGELARDASLHVTPEQVVILHLNSQPAAAKPVQHTIPYHVRKATDLRFCIPSSEPHVTYLDLETTPAHERVVRVERGGECGAVTLAPGTYALHVFHDGTRVPPGGAMAFLHRPAKRTLGSVSRSATSFAVPDFLAFRYGGNFVTYTLGQLGPNKLPFGPLAATGSVAAGFRPNLASVYRTAPATAANAYTLQDGSGAHVNVVYMDGMPYLPSPVFVETPLVGSTWAPWEFSGGANGQFSLCGASSGCVGVDSTTSELNLVDGTGVTFTADYEGFACNTMPTPTNSATPTPSGCGGTALALQEGEVALFAQPNYGGPAVVFRTDVADFSIYNTVAAAHLGIGDNMVQSVRVGPKTLAILYRDANYGGASLPVAGDVPSLAGTAIDTGAVSSMHMTAIGDYLVTTNSCEGCILTGADLSGLNLTAANFHGARLSNAILSGTVLRQARLDNAQLSGSITSGNSTYPSGTDFQSAQLRCADLSNTDLTQAQFGSMIGATFVADNTSATILRTDPTSGARVTISGGSVGSGPALLAPIGIAPGSDDTIFVADGGVGVLQVDTRTGTRTLVWNVSSGPAIGSPLDLAVDSGGQLAVLGSLGVAHLDPASGTGALVSSPARGTGVSLVTPLGLAIDGTGRLIVADLGSRALIAIDPSTGNRTVLSNNTTGTGPPFYRPTDVAFDGRGNLFVTDNTNGSPSVFKVDSQSGNRTLVSGSKVGSGPVFEALYSIAVAWDGTLFVADQERGAVVRVDPTTGARTIVSDAQVGTGPTYSAAWGLAIAPTLTFDFSCRLTATGATIDAGPGTQTFPLKVWRYMDLTNAAINNAAAAPLSTSAAALDLSGAILSGASLGGATLDGVNLNCATPSQADWHCSQLIGANLYEASLRGATAVNASLQGINLGFADLQNADLSGALLGPCGTGHGSPATMAGAYMPNINLSSAQLCSVDLSGAHLYGDSATTSLDDALLDNADLSDAICSGAQFTGTNLQGATLNRAQLVNCSFDKANLEGANFDSSYLQGADFSGAASVQGARFNNVGISATSGDWTFTEQDGTPVPYHYNATMLGPVASDSSVICPNGEDGPCTGAKLTPVSQGPKPPVPTCVPAPPDYDNCAPPAAPAAAQ